MLKNKAELFGKVGATIALSVAEKIAMANAANRCKGLLYEPEVPKKLKKNVKN